MINEKTTVNLFVAIPERFIKPESIVVSERTTCQNCKKHCYLTPSILNKMKKIRDGQIVCLECVQHLQRDVLSDVEHRDASSGEKLNKDILKTVFGV